MSTENSSSNLPVALVTGGSGVIGSAIAKQLSANGMHVLVHASSSAVKAQLLCDVLIETGGSAEPIVFDVTDADATRQALETWVTNHKAIQIIINNAGVNDDAVMPGMQTEQWRSVIDVSLNGFFNVTQPLLMPMIRTRYGRIISITSVSGITGNRGQTNYSAAKAGIHGATKSLSLELASRGITVNAVAPGIIASPMADAAFDKAMIDQMVPMKRAGKPEEVASLVGFLASKEAAYISGQIVSINGAMI
jgi:3-oxoacyl-[acyl-carrier protein] reductase